LPALSDCPLHGAFRSAIIDPVVPQVVYALDFHGSVFVRAHETRIRFLGLRQLFCVCVAVLVRSLPRRLSNELSLMMWINQILCPPSI